MDNNTSKHSLMIRRIHTLLGEADAVAHYNGSKFDIPTLNKEFVQLGLPPAKPFKQIDLYQVVKKHFRLPSNKLEYVAKLLGLKGKVKHTGHELWVKCMAGDAAAWRTMQRYNKQDVVLLEQVYNKLLPWLQGANFSTLTNEQRCPTCGTHNFTERGYYYTEARKYTLYNCNKCYTWFRHRYSERLNHSRFTKVGL
jgi:DNA polymerase III epsilon subunit-like protein